MDSYKNLKDEIKKVYFGEEFYLKNPNKKFWDERRGDKCTDFARSVFAKIEKNITRKSADEFFSYANGDKTISDFILENFAEGSQNCTIFDWKTEKFTQFLPSNVIDKVLKNLSPKELETMVIKYKTGDKRDIFCNDADEELKYRLTDAFNRSFKEVVVRVVLENYSEALFALYANKFLENYLSSQVFADFSINNLEKASYCLSAERLKKLAKAVSFESWETDNSLISLMALSSVISSDDYRDVYKDIWIGKVLDSVYGLFYYPQNDSPFFLLNERLKEIVLSNLESDKFSTSLEVVSYTQKNILDAWKNILDSWCYSDRGNFTERLLNKITYSMENYQANNELIDRKAFQNALQEVAESREKGCFSNVSSLFKHTMGELQDLSSEFFVRSSIERGIDLNRFLKTNDPVKVESLEKGWFIDALKKRSIKKFSDRFVKVDCNRDFVRLLISLGVISLLGKEKGEFTTQAEVVKGFIDEKIDEFFTESTQNDCSFRVIENVDNFLKKFDYVGIVYKIADTLINLRSS